MKLLLILLAFLFLGCGGGVVIEGDEIERWCPQIKSDQGNYLWGHAWLVSYDSTQTVVLTCERCGFVSDTVKELAKP